MTRGQRRWVQRTLREHFRREKAGKDTRREDEAVAAALDEMRRLCDEHRRLLVHRYADDRTMEQTAEIMYISVSTCQRTEAEALSTMAVLLGYRGLQPPRE